MINSKNPPEFLQYNSFIVALVANRARNTLHTRRQRSHRRILNIAIANRSTGGQKQRTS